MKTFLEAENDVMERRSNYEVLICKPLDYKVMFSMNSAEDTIDLMDSFHYIKPLAKKSCQMVFCVHVRMRTGFFLSYRVGDTIIVIQSLVGSTRHCAAEAAKNRERAARAYPFCAALLTRKTQRNWSASQLRNLH
jgi:hypothetical protein